MVELRICGMGGGLGVVLPEEVLSRLDVREGGIPYLIEAEGSSYQLVSGKSACEEKMAKAEEIMDRYRDTLAALSK